VGPGGGGGGGGGGPGGGGGGVCVTADACSRGPACTPFAEAKPASAQRAGWLVEAYRECGAQAERHEGHRELALAHHGWDLLGVSVRAPPSRAGDRLCDRYANRKSKKLHTTRAADLRMRLRQVVRAWHLYVESTRLARQRNITALMVGASTIPPVINYGLRWSVVDWL
jgi:hypothetical protein